MSEPAQKPGRSKQDYQTPPALLAAVKAGLGVAAFDCDLAASAVNAVAPKYFTEADDALTQPWPAGGLNWLNPPFERIGPWVRKARLEAMRGAETAMLVPAAVGSNWWREYVHGSADVLFLNGRVTFVGCTDPFPKDCALLLYRKGLLPARGSRYEIWNWRQDVPPADPSPRRGATRVSKTDDKDDGLRGVPDEVTRGA